MSGGRHGNASRLQPQGPESGTGGGRHRKSGQITSVCQDLQIEIGTELEVRVYRCAKYKVVYRSNKRFVDAVEGRGGRCAPARPGRRWEWPRRKHAADVQSERPSVCRRGHTEAHRRGTTGGSPRGRVHELPTNPQKPPLHRQDQKRGQK